MMTMTFPHPPLSPVMAPQPLQARPLVARQGAMHWMQHKVALKLVNHKTQNQLPLLISPGMAMEIMVVERWRYKKCHRH
ncbi:hypothetical protein NP493_698g00024 [Ridgeia piscesae]|uniref:Uncharacterized protein n=1 Tax=Ridgeia piscesae TaxID=27915 RepID=A0AAD9KS66_RIDPI|nr:hypothetical protein NP493_698g00024 [Ridgeia piscesae]